MRHECVIIADSPGALVELCGISILERLLRTLQRCGLKRAIVLSSTSQLISDALAQPSRPRSEIDLRVCHRPDGGGMIEEIVAARPENGQLLLVIRGDVVFDGRLLELLLAHKCRQIYRCGAASIRLDFAAKRVVRRSHAGRIGTTESRGLGCNGTAFLR